MLKEEKELAIKEFIQSFFKDKNNLKFMDLFYQLLQADFIKVTNDFKEQMTDRFTNELVPQEISIAEVMRELFWQLAAYKVEAINAHLKMLNESVTVSESIQPVLGNVIN